MIRVENGPPMKSKYNLAVAVSGLPGSGNKILKKILNRAGVVAEVNHFGQSEKDIVVWKGRRLDVKVLVPIREPEVHLAPGSYDKYLVRFKKPYWQQRHEHYMATLDMASRQRVPLFAVRYKRFIQDPVGTCQDIFDFLGVPFTGIPKDIEIVDGDAKWLALAEKSETT